MDAVRRSLLPPSSFQFSLVLLVLLLTISDTTASSDFADMIEISNISQNIRISEIMEIRGDKQCEEENEGSLKLDTFIGFGSSITEIYSYVDYLLNPCTKKSAVEDVLKQLETELAETKSNIKQIEGKLTKEQVRAYQDAEGSIKIALSDLKLKISSNLVSKANTLFDHLNTFMHGMPELVQTVRDIYDCGSKSMMNKMGDFIALLNIGALSIGYYSKVINNKDIFDGESRIKTLNVKKDATFKRTKDAMNNCADMTKSVVEQYITKILAANQADSVQTIDVSKLLYERFNDIYPGHITWIFYTAWKFKPYDPVIVGDTWKWQSASAIYTGTAGTFGTTKNGGWSVYWVGHPSAQDMDILPPKLLVDTEKIRQMIATSAADKWMYRSGTNLQKKFQNDFFSGRVPVASFIFVDPPPAATIGSPIGPLNVYSQRFTMEWKYYKFFGKVTYWQTNSVDVITF